MLLILKSHHILAYIEITSYFSLSEYEGAVTKHTDEKVISLKKALETRSEEVTDLETR